MGSVWVGLHFTRKCFPCREIWMMRDLYENSLAAVQYCLSVFLSYTTRVSCARPWDKTKQFHQNFYGGRATVCHARVTLTDRSGIPGPAPLVQPPLPDGSWPLPEDAITSTCPICLATLEEGKNLATRIRISRMFTPHYSSMSFASETSAGQWPHGTVTRILR
jgi:hypothetical protein